MRVLLVVQAAHGMDPGFLMGDLAEDLQERYGISRATTYRRIRQALDVLGIDYDGDNSHRRERIEVKQAEGREYRRRSQRTGRAA